MVHRRHLLLALAVLALSLLTAPTAFAQSFTCDDVTQIPQGQCQALVALYNSTNGPAWTNNSGWLSSTTPCSWYGVVCSGGSVTQLNLYSNNLNGTLPPELGDLTALQGLRLYNNSLMGSIPAELGNLASLTGLFLQQNQLSGALPPALGQLANLAQLSVHSNQLSGPIPGSFGQLAALQVLYLYGNQLSGLIPPELGSLANLRDLYLNDNQLTGSLPAQLGNLASLRNLYLSNNPLSGGLPPALGNLSQLVTLQLSNTHIGGPLPATLGSLSNLKTLRLNNTWLNGALPASLTGLALTSFYFDNTDLCEPQDAAFQTWLAGIALKGRTSEPCRLVLSKSAAPGHGQVAGTLVYTLTLRNVTTTTTFSNVVLTDTLPAAVTLISAEPLMDYRVGPVLGWGVSTPLSLAPGAAYEVVLQVGLPGSPMSLQNDSEAQGTATPVGYDHARLATEVFDFCGLVTQIPRAECAALLAFYAATGGAGWTNNSGWLSTTEPCSWFGVTCAVGQVTRLDLPNNGLSGSLPAALGDLPRLLRLDLAGNALTGSIPAELGSLARLQLLDLSGNQLSGAVPAALGNLANLQTLDLGSNQLSGAIPAELGNLATLQTLDLASNQLNGAIPVELGGLANLQTLDLASNQLSGAIPAELGNLATLQTLDLASNQLSGVIPAALGGLPALLTLNLAANQLLGAIPPQLGDLASLQMLDVSANQLSGSLPASFGDLANLQRLLVAGNGIGGTPPAQLGNLALLEQLDLSANLFSGALPDSLINLTAMADLRFATTDLCEPNSAAFQTWLGGIANVVSTGLRCRLSLTKAGAPANGGTGAVLTYTLAVRNLSTDTVYSDVVLTDTLPVSVTLLSTSVPTTTQNANALGWTLSAPLALGDAFTVTLSVQLPISPTTVENAASVVGTGSVRAKAGGQPTAVEQDAARFRTRVWQRAAPPVVRISRSGGDTVLNWDPSSVPVFHYEVWRAVNDPYFAPPTACSGAPVCTVATTTGVTFAGDSGDPANNYTYLVFAVNLGGRSDASNRVGEFDFALTPGLLLR